MINEVKTLYTLYGPEMDLHEVPEEETEKRKEEILLLADYAEQMGMTEVAGRLRDTRIYSQERMFAGWINLETLSHYYPHSKSDDNRGWSTAICGRVMAPKFFPCSPQMYQEKPRCSHCLRELRKGNQ